METLRDPKFGPKGKLRVVNASISQTNTSSLALIPVAIGADGKVDSPTYKTLGKKWGKIPADGKGWFHSQINFRPGFLNTTCVQSDVWCVHMHCLKADGSCDPKALTECFKKLTVDAKSNSASVHMAATLLEQVPQVKEHMDALLASGIDVFFYEQVKIAESEVKSAVK
jgi:hypothetical protein